MTLISLFPKVAVLALEEPLKEDERVFGKEHVSPDLLLPLLLKREIQEGTRSAIISGCSVV